MAWSVGSYLGISTGISGCKSQDASGTCVGTFGGHTTIATFSAVSFFTCYIVAAIDAYQFAKRLNAERGYANLSEKDIPKRPTINLGMRGRRNIYLALNYTF